MQAVCWQGRTVNPGVYQPFNFKAMKKQYFLILVIALLCGALPSCKKGTVYKTLIITGRGEINRMISSDAIKQILDETGMFSSTILDTPPAGEDMSGFRPEFSKYKLVVVDYEGESWPEKTSAALQEYIKNGGGLVFYDSKTDPVYGTPDSVPPWISVGWPRIPVLSRRSSLQRMKLVPVMLTIPYRPSC